jgi:hypothetical protein
MRPGNTANVTTVIPVIDRLRRRFNIARVCVVADRGMISAETIAELTRRLLYHLFSTRPIFHKLDEIVRWPRLLAPRPVLKKALEDRSPRSAAPAPSRKSSPIWIRSPRPDRAGRQALHPALRSTLRRQPRYRCYRLSRCRPPSVRPQPDPGN